MLKLDHVALQVADMDRAIAFYTKEIGLELLSDEIDETHHERFAFLRLDGGNLELLQVLDERNCPRPYLPPPVSSSHCPHVAIGTLDMDRLLDELKRGQVNVVKGPLEIPGMVRWVYVRDLDNNVLEFVQWL
ncbi:MAG: lactoylglutathione lyase [Candidatus Hydrogenedentes bacterium]|nr:lactoylglutathione lyase [Candidatus Hydrogenedentota bacterium]